MLKGECVVKVGKSIIQELIEDGFFNEWKTMNEILKKLSQRGFTVFGKKSGNVGQTLTRMCRDRSIGLERDDVPANQIEKAGGKWKYKKVR